MYEKVEKPKENKSRAIANSVGQKKSIEKQGFGLVDNRPEVTVQRRLQDTANNRSGMMQLKTIQEMARNSLQVKEVVAQREENKKNREKDDDVEPDRETVQRKVDNNRRAIGRRIIITDNYYGDRGATGTIERYSSVSDTLFAVRLDGKRGLWRVDYRDMDYWNEESSSSSSDSESEEGEWVTLTETHTCNNCVDFAFEHNTDPDFINSSWEPLIETARKYGYTEVTSISDATIVLYGRGKGFSHAIRKVSGRWEEIQYDGGPHRRYSGGGTPPKKHMGDKIVAMLKK